jgi:predicted transposase
MKRTISLKLNVSQVQGKALIETQKIFSDACNEIVKTSIENRCWNNVALHHLAYYPMREKFTVLGSQMTCNAIKLWLAISTVTATLRSIF